MKDNSSLESDGSEICYWNKPKTQQQQKQTIPRAQELEHFSEAALVGTATSCSDALKKP